MILIPLYSSIIYLIVRQGMTIHIGPNIYSIIQLFCRYIINRDEREKAQRSLTALFGKYGGCLQSVFTISDNPSEPGFGFVEFATHKDAHKVIQSMSCILHLYII